MPGNVFIGFPGVITHLAMTLYIIMNEFPSGMYTAKESSFTCTAEQLVPQTGASKHGHMWFPQSRTVAG